LNQALSAYDWTGQPAQAVDARVAWLSRWPAGNWEQQVREDVVQVWDEAMGAFVAVDYDGADTQETKRIHRYRYRTTEGVAWTWVRAIKQKGCWLLKLSPPRAEPAAVPVENAAPPRLQETEGVETQGNLHIQWEEPAQN
jgi:hypothetical protein